MTSLLLGLLSEPKTVMTLDGHISDLAGLRVSCAHLAAQAVSRRTGEDRIHGRVNHKFAKRGRAICTMTCAAIFTNGAITWYVTQYSLEVFFSKS